MKFELRIKRFPYRVPNTVRRVVLEGGESEQQQISHLQLWTPEDSGSVYI